MASSFNGPCSYLICRISMLFHRSSNNVFQVSMQIHTFPVWFFCLCMEKNCLPLTEN